MESVANILPSFAISYNEYEVSTIDGVRVDFEESWVHVRASNTEPILRIYSEAPTQDEADELAERIIREINELL